MERIWTYMRSQCNKHMHFFGAAQNMETWKVPGEKQIWGVFLSSTRCLGVTSYSIFLVYSLSSSLHAVVPNLSFNTGVAAVCLVGHRVPALPTADPLGSFPRTASRQQAWLAAFQIVQVTFPFTDCVTLKSLPAFISLIGL